MDHTHTRKKCMQMMVGGAFRFCEHRTLISNEQDDYFADIAVAYQQEIKALYEAGCRE